MHPVQWLVLLLAIASWLDFQILIEAIIFTRLASVSKKENAFGFWALWSAECAVLIYVCTLFDLEGFLASNLGIKVAFVVLVLAWLCVMFLFHYVKREVGKESKDNQQDDQAVFLKNIKRFIDRWGDQ